MDGRIVSADEQREAAGTLGCATPPNSCFVSVYKLRWARLILSSFINIKVRQLLKVQATIKLYVTIQPVNGAEEGERPLYLLAEISTSVPVISCGVALCRP
jgi:hypothetical protein